MRKIIHLALTIQLFISITMAQNNPKNLDIDWKTDLSTRAVPLEEFTTLLVPDGIPPIDEPRFWDRETARQHFFLHEPVIAVSINGLARAYPLSILTYHEIVNDRIGMKTISVTYCPLCNAALVFDRALTFKGKPYLLDFGVSGMLRNSDLVMWDRQTESWWQQFTGTALVGELTGAKLNVIPSMLISLEEFFEAYPDGNVLSTETGHFMEYGTNPYTGYDDPGNSRPRLFDGTVDQRLPAMERVIDVHVNGKYKVYPLTAIREAEVINDTFQGQHLVLFHTTKTVSVLDDRQISASRNIGSVTVFLPEAEGQALTFFREGEVFKDRQTGSSWTIAGKCISGELKGSSLLPVVHGNHFAFAWFAFHPDSEIHE